MLIFFPILTSSKAKNLNVSQEPSLEKQKGKVSISKVQPFAKDLEGKSAIFKLPFLLLLLFLNSFMIFSFKFTLGAT